MPSLCKSDTVHLENYTMWEKTASNFMWGDHRLSIVDLLVLDWYWMDYSITAQSASRALDLLIARYTPLPSCCFYETLLFIAKVSNWIWSKSLGIYTVIWLSIIKHFVILIMIQFHESDMCLYVSSRFYIQCFFQLRLSTVYESGWFWKERRNLYICMNTKLVSTLSSFY